MIFDHKGILGINARNLLYIKPYNPKKAIRLADDKIKTKQFLSTRDIAVPKLYNIIKNQEDLEKFNFNSLPSSFVIKPNQGYGGEGIIPIVEKQGNCWITAGGTKMNKNDMKDHINDILDGRFSISNIRDFAFFEQYIISDDVLGKFSYKGLPDIRVIVHNLIPVMAMLRLPTKESGGKANLHMGAVGVGIDIAKGQATYTTYKNRIIEEIPNGLGKIKGLKIPYWDEILTIASKVQYVTNLGYLAADICIDKNVGPVLLEINARAGLGVQIANLAPLRKRLERIEGVSVTNPTKGVRIAKDMFGNILEKEIENLSGKQIINSEETIEILLGKETLKIKAKIDTGETRSILDEETAEKAGLLDDTQNYEDEKSTLKVKFNLKGKRIQTIVDIEKIPSINHKMIIGNRDLTGFLVDPSSNKENKNIKKTEEITEKITTDKCTNYHEIDEKLQQIDSKIKLLYHLRPLNLETEKEKFFKNTEYNPQFEYPKLKFDVLEIIENLSKIKTDESQLGIIFKNKKEEILNKIQLLASIGEKEFTEYSIKLFGKPSSEDIENCKKLLIEIDPENLKPEKTIYDANDAQKAFEKKFEEYGLKNWKVKIKETMVANCVAGKNNRLFIKENSKFSRERIESLIVHEIETHILTAENGKKQPYEIFNRGLANYLTTQEGLAMYNVEKQRREPFKNNYKAIGHVIAINKAINHSFTETFKELVKLNIPKEQAFRSVLKAKRGLHDTSKPGAFTKDYIYYKGYIQIKDFVDKGGDIKELYIGKLNLEELEIVKSIPYIRKPDLLPSWLKK